MTHYQLLSEDEPPVNTPNPQVETYPWGWRDVFVLVGAFIVTVLILVFLVGMLAASGILNPILSQLPPTAGLAAVVIAIYLLLILGVYGFAVRKERSSWQLIGIRPFSANWLLALPFIYIGQIMVAGLLNLLLVTFLLGGEFQNPQIEILQQTLFIPTPMPETVPENASTSEAQAESTQKSEDLPQSEESESGESLLLPNQLTRVDLALLILAIGVVTPLAEEMLFRGMIYPLQRRRWRASTAIFLNALIFALVHFIPLLFPVLFVIGLVLAWLREQTKSIWPSFLLHGLQNSIAVFAFYNILNQGGVG